MSQGDRLRITLTDTRAGLLARVDDLTTGQSGFIVASGANGFQNTDPNTCAGKNFNFHPEYDTAKFGNFVPWAVLQANVNFSMEIGHFTPGPNGDNDADDAPCFPGPTVAGCIGADTDFDGTSYRPDWPDGGRNHATSLAIRSVNGGGVGPLSADQYGNYNQPYPIVQFESTVSASEQACQTNGVGCVVPPARAKFYPSYALDQDGDSAAGCSLVFGNFNGQGVNNFEGDTQFGASNLSWFFGQNSGGPRVNPCVPQPNSD